MSREELLKHPAYWFEHEQNELFRQVNAYMEKENINRTQLAERLKVSKGHITQILNGDYNYSLKKWIELCLSIGIVPGEYRKLDDVIKEDLEKSTNRALLSEKKPSFEIHIIRPRNDGKSRAIWQSKNERIWESPNNNLLKVVPGGKVLNSDKHTLLDNKQTA